MSQKLSYAKPSIVRMGDVVSKTEGYFWGWVFEIMSLRTGGGEVGG